MKVPLLKDVELGGERLAAGTVAEIPAADYKRLVDDGTIPCPAGGYVPDFQRVPPKPETGELTYPVTLLKEVLIDTRHHAPGDVVFIEERKLIELAQQGIIAREDCPRDVVIPPAAGSEPPPPEHLVKVLVKRAMMIGSRWHEAGETVEVEEARAERLVEDKDARFLDPAARRSRTASKVIEAFSV